ncbi:MAG: hypothetical protein RR314_04350 [Oscillospiraceae bacterium]
MKKVITYLLCTLMLLGTLSACGTDNGKVTPKPTNGVVATPKPTVKPTAKPTVKPTATVAPTKAPATATPKLTPTPTAKP